VEWLSHAQTYLSVKLFQIFNFAFLKFQFLSQWLPIFNESNLCSGELFRNKFIVPCNPEYYLEKQYGKDNWKIPLKKTYFNTESIKLHRDWNDQEWPYVYRRYNIFTHKLDVNKTIAMLHSNSNKTFFSTLPPDNPDYEN
jgi:hypothetical protein